MSRLRLGAALMLPAPLAGEVQGLRRACGDHGRMAPHLTLVPPVNVRRDEVDEALSVLRRAASQTRPFTLTLGPPATFLPDNPVLYLEVGGDVDALVELRSRIFVGPLSRTLTWPFTPHVTICDSGEPTRLEAAVVALADFRVDFVVERVHLLHEQPHDGHRHRRWVPFLDAVLAEPVVVGRGGFELELIPSECFDAWSRATVASWQQEEPGASGESGESGGRPPLLSGDARADEAGADEAGELASVDEQWDLPGVAEPVGRPLVLRAVHDGALVGVLIGHRSGHVGVIESGIVAPDQRRHGIARHLLGAFVSAMADEGASQVSAWAPAGSPGEHWLRAAGFAETHARDHRLHLVRVLDTGNP